MVLENNAKKMTDDDLYKYILKIKLKHDPKKQPINQDVKFIY